MDDVKKDDVVKEDIKEDVKEDVKDEVKRSEDEVRAMNLGWKPKDQWQGGEDEWVPAKWWLKYGDVEQKAIILEQQDKHKDKVIASMKGHYIRVKEDSIKEALDIIKRQKKEAVKNEDFQKVAELDVQADELETGLKARYKQSDIEVGKVDVPQGPPPEFISWNRENSWYKYGTTTDELTNEADTLAVGYSQRNPNVPYKDVLAYVEDKIKKLYPDKFMKDTPKVSAVDDGGGVTQSQSRPSKGGYKLNEAEKAAAQAFGIPEAEYAKDLEKFDSRKGR